MKTFLLCFCGSLFFALSSTAQTADTTVLVTLNQKIDDAVVSRDSNFLKSVYADDFIFSHGSGKVEGKLSWLKSVAKGGFEIRHHDSVTVEMHPELAIVRGKLSVQKKSATKTDRYFLKYFRVYALRKMQWELVSHKTVYEEHENR